MKTRNLILFIAVLMSFMIGCAKESEKEEKPSKETAVEEKEPVTFTGIQFTGDEEAYLRELKKKGVLKIAVEKSGTVYEPQEDGSIKGFHYKLAKSFADYMGVNLETKVVPFKDFFTINGEIPEDVQTNPNRIYTPDLIKEVDILIDNTTILPWREKLLRFVEVLPNKMMLVTRKGEEIRDLKELKGKVIVTAFESSYYTRFRQIEEEIGTEFKYVFVDNTSLMFQALEENKGDVSARDASRVIFEFRKYKNLSVSMPISEVQHLGWGVRKENKVLASILDKYLQYARSTGFFNKCWMEDYDITLTEYLRIMDYNIASKKEIDFTKEEEAYLRELKKKGVIKIATRKTPAIYEPQKDGSVRGFHYNLLKSFADNVGVELEVKIVEFKDYFSINGETPENVFIDPTYSYTPDLIREVDLYMDSLTVLPWREKLLDFVDLIPTKIVLVTRKGEEINDLKNLEGKVIVTVFESSYYTKFKEIENKLGEKFDYLFVKSTTLTFKHVSDKRGDVTARDANTTILALKDYGNLNACIPISDVQQLAWAVKKDNKVFASILKKYIQYSKRSGLLNKFWLGDYNVSLDEYYGILEYEK